MNPLPQSVVQCENPDRDTLALSGALTFANVAAAFDVAGRALCEGVQTRLDLAEVTRADSAGLACVLALLAQASRAGRPLTVLHPPDGLRALAEVCDAGALLQPGKPD
ncbi:MAG TPA: STAS domain-containing protein [Rhodanobacteraceae bacterium]|nr:STAS domain-containing protein [Rhodanobacteraceae bacterium]